MSQKHWLEDPLVQHAFLWSIGACATPSRITTPDDLPSFESLRQYAVAFHAQVEPPPTDYIVWLWKGRPAPAW
jgi:hypothetical protein